MGAYLRRYTDVLSLIDILTHRRITLTSPSRWVDQNDSHALEVYRRRLDMEYVTAMCLTEADETYHHWHVFAGHSHGVCVVFHKKELIIRLNGVDDIVHDHVTYRNLSSINREKEIPTRELPFLKREMFKDECEYRIVSVEGVLGDTTRSIPINIELIDRIVFSPYAPRPLLETLKDRLNVDGDIKKIPFRHSTLTNNLEWRKAIDFVSKK